MTEHLISGHPLRRDDHGAHVPVEARALVDCRCGSTSVWPYRSDRGGPAGGCLALSARIAVRVHDAEASHSVPSVLIMDPLAGRWSFPRAHGVRPAPTTAGTPVICDVSVGRASR